MPAGSAIGTRTIPEVALLVETSTSFGRDVLSGIALYARENGPWSVKLEQRSIREGMPAWLPRWRGDGVVSRLPLSKMAHFAHRTGIPVVDLNEQVADLGLPLVFNDERAIGRMAAEHLLERGFKQFGYIGQRGGFWSDGRRDGFAAAVEEVAYSCDEFTGKGRTVDDYQRRVWETETPDVIRWVKRLPKPVGVMACNAFRACQLVEACRVAGVAVPEQLAVIAGDNEQIACRMAIPPLSAVVNSAHQIGYEAASLLDTLMHGKPATQQRLFVPPERVITRQSTDITAIHDPLVATAVQFIRERACQGITVDDVLRVVLVSRTKLQDRFRHILGRTIHDMIVSFRVDRAKELLTDTSLPLPDVAGRSGFKHVQYMSEVFQQRTGVRPGKYRAQHLR